ncbi:glutathione S-transferase family protein [Telmatospirillum sp. J64-1]|uniref:glutathione S-transferase family protein n=1 Tax=Telmatospirillum sp. J64-1 TaxID=2502183 RepID=UPI00115D6B7D|nr:glutathione S-transferase N-terminal domain-containing protein [Telmatospirillum sp. J64-1]
MLTLYYSPGACSLVPHVALEETGAQFEAKPVYLRKGQHKQPEYLAINPKGKVPALDIGGCVLTENPAILTYIARTFPEARLLPSGDLVKEVEALSLLCWFSSGVHPVIGRFFGPARICDAPGSEGRLLEIAREGTAQNFGMIEKMLEGREWLLGDYSVADAYAYVFFSWAKALNLDVSAYGNYAAHFERVGARQAVQRALAREAEARAAMEG